MPFLFRAKSLAFSLIELIVVIALVGILAAIAIPSYKTYRVSSTIGGLMPLADNVKSDVEAAHNQGTVFGSSYSQTYIASGASNKPTGLYSLKAVGYGCVDLQIDLAAVGLDGSKTLIATWCPTENSGAVEWQCGYDSSSYASYLSYLPANCQTVNTSIQNTSF